MTCGIYKIKFSNGKLYIGQAQNFEKRKKRHEWEKDNKDSDRYHYPVYRAMRKYPDYEFELFKEVSVEDLDTWEIYYIAKFKTYPPSEFGYNQTIGGGGTIGYKPSEETLKKMSESMKKKRKYPGCVSPYKNYGKFEAFSEHPNRQYLGIYNTREEAEAACWNFHKTGFKKPLYRAKGCVYERNNTYAFSVRCNGKVRSRTFKTREEAEALQKKWIETHDVNCLVSQKVNKGTICMTPYNTYKFGVSLNKKRYRKTYKTREEAEAAQKKWIETQDVNLILK